MKETKRINNKLLCEACSNVFKETIVEYIESWKNSPLSSPSQGQTNELEIFEQYIIGIAKKLAKKQQDTALIGSPKLKNSSWNTSRNGTKLSRNS